MGVAEAGRRAQQLQQRAGGEVRAARVEDDDLLQLRELGARQVEHGRVGADTGEAEVAEGGAELAELAGVHTAEPLQVEAGQSGAEAPQQRHHRLVKVEPVSGEGGVAEVERGQAGEAGQLGQEAAAEVSVAQREALQPGTAGRGPDQPRPRHRGAAHTQLPQAVAVCQLVQLQQLVQHGAHVVVVQSEEAGVGAEEGGHGEGRGAGGGDVEAQQPRRRALQQLQPRVREGRARRVQLPQLAAGRADRVESLVVKNGSLDVDNDKIREVCEELCIKSWIYTF